MNKTTRPGRPGPLKMDLLANGVDFVRSAVSLLYASDPEPADYKYAVMHVFSGALLILKERLRREHQSLIWVDVTEAGSDEARTVDFSTCLDRLAACADVKLDASQRKLLSRSQKKRNRLEHYEVELNLDEAKTLVAEMVQFVFCFMRDELEERLEDDLTDEVWERVQELRQIAKKLEVERAKAHAEFVAESEGRLAKLLVGASPTQADWLRRAFKYDKLTPEELSDLARDHLCSEDPHSPPATGYDCPECWENGSVISVDHDLAICTNPECREAFTEHSCPRCGGGGVLDDNSGEKWCDACNTELAEKIARDD